MRYKHTLLKEKLVTWQYVQYIEITVAEILKGNIQILPPDMIQWIAQWWQ